MKEDKMKKEFWVTPPEIYKKLDQRKGGKMTEKLFTKRFTFNRLAKQLDAKMGISTDRVKLIMEKLSSVAKFQPDSSVIIESLLNDETFTDTEKALGIYALAEICGMLVMIKSLKIKQLNLSLPPQMAGLFNIMMKRKDVPDPIVN